MTFINKFTSAGKPIYQSPTAKKRGRPPKLEPPPPKVAKESWWTKHASPSAPRAGFTTAAKQRADEMVTDHRWNTVEHMRQISEMKRP